MMKEDKQLDDLFRSKLENFEMKPPAHLWDGILEKQAAAKKKKGMLIWWISGTAASLLLAFFLGWELQKGQSDLIHELPIASQQQISDDNNVNKEDAAKPFIFAADKNEIVENNVQRQDSGTAIAVVDNVNRQIEAYKNDDTNTIVADLKRDSNGQVDLIKSIISRLGWTEQETDQLDELRISEHELTEEDWRIIAANSASFEEEQKKGSEMSWKLGAMVTPVLNVNQTKYTQQYAASMSSSGSARDVSLGGGLTVEMQTRSRWSIQSGIQYNRIAQNAPGSSSVDYMADPSFSSDFVAIDRSTTGQVVVNGAAGQVVLNSVSESSVVLSDFESAAGIRPLLMTRSEFDQVFDYVEIPLLVRYQLLDRVVGIQLSAGLNTGFLVRNAVYASGENVGHTADMNDYTLSSTMGIGFGYKLSSNLQLRLEPQLRYFLQSLSNNDNISYKPYSFGFSTGVSYSF